MRLALAASVVNSPPPCGEGLGVGVRLTQNLCFIPPTQTLPPKGGGNGESAQGGVEQRAT
jgi:hypothetical protein